MGRTIERQGVTTGRWPRYTLVVDGVDVGTVRRTNAVGRDGLAGRGQPRSDGWAIHGVILTSQADAEAKLIERAVRFGHLAGEK